MNEEIEKGLHDWIANRIGNIDWNELLQKLIDSGVLEKISAAAVQAAIMQYASRGASKAQALALLDSLRASVDQSWPAASGAKQGQRLSPEDIPLRSCLFWPDARGDIQDTWSLFADDAGDASVLGYADWHRSRDLNAVVFLLSHERKMRRIWEFIVNGQAQHEDYCRAVYRNIQAAGQAGTILVPAFFDEPNAGYDPIIKAPMEQRVKFFRDLCPVLNPHVAGYIVGCESNCVSTAENEAMIDAIQQFTEKPVGVHMAWNPNKGSKMHGIGSVGGWRGKQPKLRRGYAFPRNARFLAGEAYWHPKDGDDKSITAVTGWATTVRDGLPEGVAFWPLEYNLNPVGRMIVLQSQALAKLPGVWGVGGPMI